MQAFRATPLLQIRTNNVTKMRTVYEYSINKVEVLRKRHDSKERCDENLLDETQMIFNTVMRNVKCIPAYLQIFADKSLHILPKCKQSQYRTINENYTSNNLNNFKNNLRRVRAMYTQPCSSMTLSTTYKIRIRESEDKSILSIIFRYEPDYYKEILNKRAFTSEDLLAQVGGYVGRQ